MAAKKTVPKKPPLSSTKKTASKKSVRYNTSSFPIVGIGASAGGLEAIEGFFSHMPSDSGMAFVVIQHLDPHHKSSMDTIVSRFTTMSVRQAEDGMKIEPNSIYLNPPDRYLAVINRTFQLAATKEFKTKSLPIDYCFRSISEDQREKTISIILSGTGTDGTLGLKATKGAGGMVMAQEEKQAGYSGMPGSAIQTGLVDFILPVEKMPDELIRYVRHPYLKAPELLETDEQQFQTQLQKIFIAIRTVTGNDFSNYKQNTIRRRIERRMALHQIEKISDYTRYLQKNTAEIELLYKDFLINVTNFLRDPEAFDLLEKKAIPKLLKNKKPGSTLRVWVAGCSTGEEAYSMAIIFIEAIERLKTDVYLQVFATDIDGEAIEYARTGVYPDSIAENLSPERLKRFFTKAESGYKVKKQVRDMVIFAVQNLIKDPPFSKQDMVTCRNVMIYLDSVLQKRIIPLFHYVLNQDGILFLGSSETIGGFSDLFSTVNLKWKIYLRAGSEPPKGFHYPGLPLVEAMAESHRGYDRKIEKSTDIRELAEKLIIKSFAPPFVLINERYDILYFHGDTDKYLVPPKGEPRFNLMNMVRAGLRYNIGPALLKAIKQKKMIRCDGLQLNAGSYLKTVDVIIRPVIEPSSTGLFMVVFEDRTPKPEKKTKIGKMPGEGARIRGLEEELSYTKEHLQTTIEDLGTSNEELKSTNEELQSTNEELQSTVEEAETSKEELHSTNEELTTVNAELQYKLEELSKANDDIQNLLAGIEIGVIFLDPNFCIKRFTPSAARAFNIRQGDIGRPLKDITSKIRYGKIYRDAEEVLNTLIKKEVDVRTVDGESFLMRILPYRTTENIVDGLIISFADVTKIKKSEEHVAKLNEQLKKELAERKRMVENYKKQIAELEKQVKFLKSRGSNE